MKPSFRAAFPDRIGVALSSLCAIHCLIGPVAFALVSSLSLALHSFNAPDRSLAIFLLHMQRFDRPLAATALALAIVSATVGWRKHRRPWAFAWIALGAASLTYGLMRPGGSAIPHVAALVIGGMSLAIAHATNLRLLQGVAR